MSVPTGKRQSGINLKVRSFMLGIVRFLAGWRMMSSAFVPLQLFEEQGIDP